MTETETLSKAEYNYLQTIDKYSQLIEALKKELSSKENDLETLKAQHDSFKNEVEGSVHDCQHEIDAEALQYEKTIAELRAKVLPDVEMQFYFLSKADVILFNLFKQNKSIMTAEELKQLSFPMVLLDKTNGEQIGIRTSNFSLVQAADNTFKLSQNGKTEN